MLLGFHWRGTTMLARMQLRQLSSGLQRSQSLPMGRSARILPPHLWFAKLDVLHKLVPMRMEPELIIMPQTMRLRIHDICHLRR
jgi:hypothetical protein